LIFAGTAGRLFAVARVAARAGRRSEVGVPRGAAGVAAGLPVAGAVAVARRGAARMRFFVRLAGLAGARVAARLTSEVGGGAS
jgi:hypothetical protein